MSVAAKKAPEPRAEQTQPMPNGWLLPPFPGYRFTVEQYHRMIDSGILTENDRVELVGGWILPKMTHNPPHDATVSLVQSELLARVSTDWVVRIQSAITTGDSEPEPDAVVARGPARRYMRAHPRPRDIALLIEVADATLDYDRTFKATRYALARIAVYWIVNLIHRQIEVHTQPRAGKDPGYRQERVYGQDESAPLVVGGVALKPIAVRDLLP